MSTSRATDSVQKTKLRRLYLGRSLVLQKLPMMPRESSRKDRDEFRRQIEEDSKLRSGDKNKGNATSSSCPLISQPVIQYRPEYPCRSQRAVRMFCAPLKLTDPKYSRTFLSEVFGPDAAQKR